MSTGSPLKRPLVILAGVIAALLAWWGGSKLAGEEDAPAASRGAGYQRTSDELVELSRAVQARSEAAPWTPPPRLDGAVTISGTVIDADTGESVGGVEVVFRSEVGEETTTAGANGAYWIDLPIGTYRAFVRGATVLAVEPPPHGGMQSDAVAGLPDEALMPVVVADVDRDGVDLTVMRGGALRGTVVDTAGRGIGSGHGTQGEVTVPSGGTGRLELALPEGGDRLCLADSREGSQ